jgi:hypothetical protein
MSPPVFSLFKINLLPYQNARAYEKNNIIIMDPIPAPLAIAFFLPALCAISNFFVYLASSRG